MLPSIGKSWCIALPKWPGGPIRGLASGLNPEPNEPAEVFIKHYNRSRNLILSQFDDPFLAPHYEILPSTPHRQQRRCSSSRRSAGPNVWMTSAKPPGSAGGVLRVCRGPLMQVSAGRLLSFPAFCDRLGSAGIVAAPRVYREPDNSCHRGRGCLWRRSRRRGVPAW